MPNIKEKWRIEMNKLPNKGKQSPIITGFINMFFDMIKHFLHDFENMRKVKKIDHITEKFSTLEHMLIRLEDKIQENHYRLEELKNRILWGNIIILVLLAIILFEIFSK